MWPSEAINTSFKWKHPTRVGWTQSSHYTCAFCPHSVWQYMRAHDCIIRVCLHSDVCTCMCACVPFTESLYELASARNVSRGMSSTLSRARVSPCCVFWYAYLSFPVRGIRGSNDSSNIDGGTQRQEKTKTKQTKEKQNQTKQKRARKVRTHETRSFHASTCGWGTRLNWASSLPQPIDHDAIRSDAWSKQTRWVTAILT